LILYLSLSLSVSASLPNPSRYSTSRRLASPPHTHLALALCSSWRHRYSGHPPLPSVGMLAPLVNPAISDLRRIVIWTGVAGSLRQAIDVCNAAPK
jgi:hypothetical protein